MCDVFRPLGIIIVNTSSKCIITVEHFPLLFLLLLKQSCTHVHIPEMIQSSAHHFK